MPIQTSNPLEIITAKDSTTQPSFSKPRYKQVATENSVKTSNSAMKMRSYSRNGSKQRTNARDQNIIIGSSSGSLWIQDPKSIQLKARLNDLMVMKNKKVSNTTAALKSLSAASFYEQNTTHHLKNDKQRQSRNATTTIFEKQLTNDQFLKRHYTKVHLQNATQPKIILNDRTNPPTTALIAPQPRHTSTPGDSLVPAARFSHSPPKNRNFRTSEGGGSGGGRARERRQRVFITAYQIENQLKEINMDNIDSYDDEIGVILDLVYPESILETENMFESAEFWLNKGLQLHTGQSEIQINLAQKMNIEERKRFVNMHKHRVIEKEDYEQALDFYFQGLRLDPFHFGCCFNAGVAFLQLGMNVNAQKWFRFARKLKNESKEPYLGEAISSLKMGNIQECLEVVRARPGQKNKRRNRYKTTRSQLITNTSRKAHSNNERNSESPHSCQKSSNRQLSAQVCRYRHNDDEQETILQYIKLDIEHQFKFLEAIAYRLANEFDKSQKEYQKLENIFQRRLGERMARYIFTNLMLPMQTDRKIVEDYVQIFLDELNIIDRDAHWDPTQYESFLKLLDHKKEKFYDLDSTVSFLQDKPLFKRLFRKEGFCAAKFKKVLSQFDVIIKEHGQTVQCVEEEVFIVLNGRVVLRYHDKDPLDYQYIAQYTPGRILCHKTLDQGYSLLGSVFPIVVSQRCVLVRMTEKLFDQEVWANCKDRKLEVKISFLRNFQLIKELWDQTLYEIIYDQKKILVFKPGALVLKCHPRSPFSSQGRKLYDEEYGSHMKQDMNKVVHKCDSGAGGRQGRNQAQALNMSKHSAFSNFFMMVNQKKKEREKSKTSLEQALLQSYLVPKMYVPGRPPESNFHSLCLILDGSCRVINYQEIPKKSKESTFSKKASKGMKFQIHELRRGDHFGASDLLRIQDIEYLGDLVAGDKGVKVLVIEKPDQVIQLCERKTLQEKLQGKYECLRMILENKFNIKSKISNLKY